MVGLQYGVHALDFSMSALLDCNLMASRSSVVCATLSRTYSGSAWSAGTAMLAANISGARRNMAVAVGIAAKFAGAKLPTAATFCGICKASGLPN